MLSGRIGAAKSLEELEAIGKDIAKAGLGQQAKGMLAEVYKTHKRRLENE